MSPFSKQLTIKTNGKNSVIIKQNVENKNLHRYIVTKRYKYARNMYEVKICKNMCKKNLQRRC